MSDPVQIKMVIVGDACVGKTCVLISYTSDRFPTDYVPTVFQNYAATVKVGDTNVNLGLWDTAGQEQYNRLRPLAYGNCDVFLIAFSVIDPSSFVNARKKWYPELQQYAPNAMKVFIGNKIDLRSQEKKKNKSAKETPIEYEAAKNLINQQAHSKYYECSALTQQGLKEIFTESMQQIIKSKRKSIKPEEKRACNLI